MEGSLAHAAAAKHFSSHALTTELRFSANHSAALQELSAGSAQLAVVAENGTGLTAGAFQLGRLIAERQLEIAGEQLIPLSYVLASNQDVALDEVAQIFVDPESLANCSTFLNNLAGCEVLCVGDAAAALTESRFDAAHRAAIVTAELAQRRRFNVLEEKISDQTSARFLLVSQQGMDTKHAAACKTSLLVTSEAGPAVAAGILKLLETHDIRVLNFESCGAPGTTQKQYILLDLEGRTSDSPVQTLLAELAKLTHFVRVLGCYPMQERSRSTAPRMSLVSSKIAESPRPGDSPETVRPSASEKTPASAKVSSHRLASRHHKSEDTVIKVKGVEIGGPEFIVIAGPCAVESREQVVMCAKEAKSA
jgi:chorismate mutase/prephenate dehydratase